ncbi:MAG: 3-deoxy-D-manno-octulosonic acid transferase [Rhodobacteraceae bacterium]|nr:3-deoxy-D-manno-octulosonic acid transferase [Paracoccaceae bacterium]
MAGPSWQTRAYLAFAAVSEPLWRLALSRRAKRGKEDPARLPEKLGHAALPRPEGRLVWVHALSVGESLALLPLLDRITGGHPDLTVLLTTSTRSSVDALRRQALPERVIHQMLPVDATGPIRRFLDHWRPEAAIFAELDFWPALLCETHRRGIPMALVNSRMSEKNYAKRRRGAAMFRDIVRLFGVALLQDDGSRERFAALGADPARLQVLGALKGAPHPLPADPATLAALRAAIGDRPVWLAASTEPREEAAVSAAHAALRRTHPDALLILAPRHPDRAAATLEVLSSHVGQVARWSLGTLPDAATEVLLADSIGEMGLWYRLSPVTFMGHSLPVDGAPLRGKNPFEAAVLHTAILHGPAVIDFEETYALLDSEGAAVAVPDAAALPGAVTVALDPARRAELTANADRVLAQTAQVLDRTYEALLPFLSREPAG